MDTYTPHCDGKVLPVQDAEYGTLFTLLDSFIPLVLSIYSISFKLNNFSEYFSAMIRIWIMFTCLQRRHYYKALLVWINMCSHWGNMLHNCIIHQGITLPFLMNIPWKRLIAYSVHRQKVLILLMNLVRKQSTFSSKRINNHTTGHFSPHLNSFLSLTTNFGY